MTVMMGVVIALRGVVTALTCSKKWTQPLSNEAARVREAQTGFWSWRFSFEVKVLKYFEWSLSRSTAEGVSIVEFSKCRV